MAKFRIRPTVTIEAEQWFTGKEVDGVSVEKSHAYPGHMVAIVATLEGDIEVAPGDWILTGGDGEKYPCKPDMFEKTYEPVEE